MKYFKLILIVLSLVPLFAVESAGQTIKRNADGQKLIKRISSDLLQIDGTVHPGSYNDSYDMTYFPDGRLKSITLSCRDFDKGGRVAERISVEADTFNLAYIKNGRKNEHTSTSSRLIFLSLLKCRKELTIYGRSSMKPL